MAEEQNAYQPPVLPQQFAGTGSVPSQHAQPQQPQPDPDPDPQAPPEPQQAPDPQQADPPGPLNLPDGLTQEELDALVGFREWARQNPNVVASWAEVLEGRAQIVPIDAGRQPTNGQPTGPAPQTGPEPQQAPAPEWAQQVPEPLAEHLTGLSERVEHLGSYVEEAVFQRNLEAVSAGSEQFAKQYGLSAQELEQLEEAVNQRQMLPAMAARAGSPSQGMFDALEVAYFSNPAFRERELQRQAQVAAQAEQRKANAGALAGASGSAPRNPVPAPAQSRPELTNRIAEEIRQAQQGQTG